MVTPSVAAPSDTNPASDATGRDQDISR